MEQQPIRVVVEVASPEVVKRLEQLVSALSIENQQLSSRLDRLHQTVYDYMAREAERSRNKR